MAGHPLDNALWHSMVGRHRERSVVVDGAARFDPEVSVFAALPDEPTADHWRALARLHEPGEVTALFRVGIEPGPGWDLIEPFAGVQFVSGPRTAAGAAPDPDAMELTAADVPEMLALVAATRPGPFRPRTVELGTYLGIHRGGVLVAMAGERAKLDGFTEISGVCTVDEARRQGHAARLVAELVRRIHGRGEQAFLHASTDNPAAIALYDRMGFERRTIVDGAKLRVPGPGAIPDVVGP